MAASVRKFDLDRELAALRELLEISTLKEKNYSMLKDIQSLAIGFEGFLIEKGHKKAAPRKELRKKIMSFIMDREISTFKDLYAEEAHVLEEYFLEGYEITEKGRRFLEATEAIVEDRSVPETFGPPVS